MRLLITGSGRIASNLAWRAAGSGWQTFITYRTKEPAIKGVKAIPGDVKFPESLRKVLQKARPQVVIHTAALTNHEDCERKTELAYEINVQGTISVARASLEHSAGFVLISSDNVYDGKKGNYSEDELPSPLCHFGKTKLEAERALSQLGGNGLQFSIVRTGPIYGWCQARFPWNSPSPSEGLIAASGTGKQMVLFEDEIRSFILVDSLSAALLKIANRIFQGKQVLPLYHIGGNRANRYEFGLRIASAFNLDPSFIKRGRIASDWKGLAPRPENCSLNTSRARSSQILDPVTDFLSLDEGINELKNPFC